MDSELPHHLALSLLLFPALTQNLDTLTAVSSAYLAESTESSFLSFPSRYASLPPALSHRTRSHLHALFRKLHKSLQRCHRRLSYVSGSHHNRWWTSAQVKLANHRLHKFQRSLKHFDACVASIEEIFTRINNNHVPLTTDPSIASSRPVNQSTAASHRPPPVPPDLTGMGPDVVTPSREEAVLASEVTTSGKVGGTSMSNVSAMPRRVVADVGHIEGSRGKKVNIGGTGNRAVDEGAAVQARERPWAGNAMAEREQKVEREVRGLAAAVSVGVYTMLASIFAAVMVWKKGGGMH